MSQSFSAYTKTGGPATLPADDTLYIYYLHGRAGYCDHLFGPAFLGNWEEDDCSFLFFTQNMDKEVTDWVTAQPALSLRDTFVMPYSQWQPLEEFPLQAGGFLIYPPCQKKSKNSADDHLILNPGVVFGNGFHPTTRACLEALEIICCNHPGDIRSALDVGTGSGLLAIAAALRGVDRVVGTDLNFLAARTARQNTAHNQVQDRVLIIKGDAADINARPVDLFMANIHYDVMDRLLQSRVFRESRFFILSGLLRTPAKKVAEKLNKMSTKIIKSWNNDEIWFTFLGEKS